MPLAAEEQAVYQIDDIPAQIRKLKKEMQAAAKKLELRAGRLPAGPDPGPGGGPTQIRLSFEF